MPYFSREPPPESRPSPAPTDTPFADKAAAVLQQELEDSGMGNSPIRAESPLMGPLDLEPTLERFQRQARELLDTLVALLGNRPEQLSQFMPAAGELERLLGGDEQIIPLLKAPPPVKPGQVGEILLSMENDDGSEPAERALYVTDLVGDSGYRIPGSQINVSPSRARIAAGGSEDVRIEIRVPNGTPPGSYAGLIQTDDISERGAVLRLVVDS